MIMEWPKKLNLIHDLCEKNYFKYITLLSITYGPTSAHNMSFIFKAQSPTYP